MIANLCKTYFVPERDAGLWPSLKSLVRRKSRAIQAVDAITFDIASGEVVEFLGLTARERQRHSRCYPGSSILQRAVSVLGSTPWRHKKVFLRQITLIMGNCNQLLWDLLSLDSFELNRAIYYTPEAEFKRTRNEFIDLLDLGTLVNKPVRNLSLGERMKMEIVGSLVHRPRVLFLDGPTIGLDVTMREHAAPRSRPITSAMAQRYC
jgi:ABC-2 type transport system ATP-binding protein